MKKYVFFLLASVALISFSSCEESSTDALDTSFASFTTTSMDIGIDQGGEATQELKIYTSNKTNSDRTISVAVEESTTASEGAFTVPATVVIPAGTNEGTLTINLQDVDLSLTEAKFLVIRLTSTNDLSTGQALTIGLTQKCPSDVVEVKINLAFDSWPEEAAWRILDADGYTVMASADPFAYGGHAGMSSFSTKNCLDHGTYTIQIFDGYGDGGTSYSIIADGTEVFSLSASGYADFYTATFTL